MDQAGNSWLARLWHHTSLVQRMAFVALVPTLITAALLVTLLTQRQLETLHQMARGNAHAIATQTASVCVQPLRAMRLRELLRIADSIGELPHVTRVQIRTADGQILADHRAADDGYDVTSVVHEVVDTEQATPQVLGSVLVDVSLRDAVTAQRATLRHALSQLLHLHHNLLLLEHPLVHFDILEHVLPVGRLLAGLLIAHHVLSHRHVRHLNADQMRIVHLNDRVNFGILKHGFDFLLNVRYASVRAFDFQNIVLFNPALFHCQGQHCLHRVRAKHRSHNVHQPQKECRSALPVCRIVIEQRNDVELVRQLPGLHPFAGKSRAVFTGNVDVACLRESGDHAPKMLAGDSYKHVHHAAKRFVYDSLPAPVVDRVLRGRIRVSFAGQDRRHTKAAKIVFEVTDHAHAGIRDAVAPRRRAKCRTLDRPRCVACGRGRAAHGNRSRGESRHPGRADDRHHERVRSG